MGLAGLIQRQSLVKRRADLPQFQEIESKLQFGHAAHPRAYDPPLVAEKGIEMRDCRFSSAAQPEVHDGAARLQALEISRHRRPADRIDDDIDSIPPGPAADGRAHIGLSIANDL